MRQAFFLSLILLSFYSIATSQTIPYKDFKYEGQKVRFEGQQEIPVGNPDLELISFMGYREKFEENKSYNLRIGFYYPYSETDSLYIIASELEITNKSYFMRPIRKNWQKSKWQEFTQWPTNDVIDPLKIRVNRIGLVGRLNFAEEGSGNIVPLNLYSLNSADSIASYILHFRPNEDLRSLTYQVIELASNQTVDQGNLERLSGQGTYPIMLDFLNKKPGYYMIILKGKLRDDPKKGPYREYTFFHNPKVE